MSDFQDKVIEELTRTKVPVSPIKLARIAERDGLVFLCDKEGKELGQVVPKELTPEQRIAFFAESLGLQFQYQSMLSAAKVDVSAAVVKVPDRLNIPAATEWDDGKMYGWNACLDALEEE